MMTERELEDFVDSETFMMIAGFAEAHHMGEWPD